MEVIMTNQNTQNGHGFFRKKKWAKGLASGIALGAVVTISGAAYADDATNTVETQPEVTVVSDSNATNLAQAQADNSQSHTDLTNQSGEQTGQLTETVTSDGLDQSVSDAKQAGVEVDENGTVTHSSYADAQADLAKQKEVVDQIAETQKEVDNAKATAEEAAKAAGVEVSNEASKSAKTYTSVEAAQADVQKQVDNLSTVTEAQKQVNDQLPKAVEVATASGVKVTVKAGAKTSDAKQALDKLANQVASLQEAQTTQNTIKYTMAQALADAKKAGVTVNTSGSKSYSDLAQALADAQAQVAKLTEFKETQESIDAAIKQSADNAKASGVTVSTGETKTYTSVEEAQADSAKQTSSLDNVAATQKEADKVISDLTKQAQKAGLDLTKGESKSYSSIDEAKQDLAKQQEALSKAKEAKTNAESTNRANAQTAQDAQDSANKAITDAINKAKATGTTVTTAGTIETTVAEAQKIAQEQVKKINETVAKNQAALAEYESHKNEIGYLSEPSAQSLIFKSEPNAQHTVSKAEATGDELARVEAGMRQEAIDTMNNSTSKQYIIATGESISVTYTNLENSSLDGAKIAKVVYTYTLNRSDYGNEVVLGFNDDPTATLFYLNGDKDFNLNMDVKFYDGDGKLIDPTGSLVSFASLNTGGINGDWEGVSDFSGDFISINGSSIAIQSDGVARSNGSNSYKNLGSQYDAGEWDVDGNPLEYYGAIVGKAEGNINFNIRSTGRGYVWFAFNSNVKAHDVFFKEPATVQNIHITPEVVSIPKDVSLHDVKLQAETHAIKLETKVVPITVETEVTTPALSATVHDITMKAAVHPVEVTQKPTNEKAVTNNDNVDINGKTVAKGSTVKWLLKNGNLLAGRKELTAVVMNDPFPAGFEVDSEATAEANADYYTLKTTENGSYQLVGTAKLLSLLNAHRDQDVEVPGFVFVGKPLNDNAHYDNAFETIYSTAKGYYKVVSNIPSIDTPDNPNPTKTVTDKAGSDIDGKTVFDKDVTFHLITDYSTYVNTVVDVNTMTKAAGIYDDTDDATVNPDVAKATVTDSNGNDITAKGTFYDIEAGQPIPAEIQIFLDGAHLTPNGEFIVWIPNDLKDYYENYVLTGNNVTVNLPVEVIAQPGEKAENTFVQVEFGNGYQSNLVFVKVPDVSPEKHAISKDGTVLDGQEVGLNQVFNYKLDGVTVPKDHDTLWQYDGKDKLDIEHDRYTGNWKGVITGTEYTAKEDMTLTYDVITEDGTVIKAGDTIAAGTNYHFIFEFNQDTNDDFINKIVKVTWNAQAGEWAYSINEDFLRSLGVEGTFDADFWIEVERIKDGEVENTFINTVNGRELVAKVTTHTPTPETPGEPEEPTKTVEEVPVVKAAALPMTGEKTTPMNVLATLIGLMMTVGAVFGLRKKEKHN